MNKFDYKLEDVLKVKKYTNNPSPNLSPKRREALTMNKFDYKLEDVLKVKKYTNNPSLNLSPKRREALKPPFIHREGGLGF